MFLCHCVYTHTSRCIYGLPAVVLDPIFIQMYVIDKGYVSKFILLSYCVRDIMFTYLHAEGQTNFRLRNLVQKLIHIYNLCVRMIHQFFKYYVHTQKQIGRETDFQLTYFIIKLRHTYAGTLTNFQLMDLVWKFVFG